MIIKKLTALIVILLSVSINALPTAKITLKVVDQKGLPISNAKIGVGISKPKINGFGSEETSIKGLTNSDGLFTAKGSTEPYVGFNIKKEGYYKTLGHFRDFTSVSGVIGFRKYKTWNPTIKVVLKKIKNPIPMYVGRLLGQTRRDHAPAILPEFDKFFGYDLVARDWVSPYGKGEHRDFIFKMTTPYIGGAGDYDVSIILKFTNPKDGIQSFYQHPQPKYGGSDLRSPHQAPEKNYQNELVIRNKQIKGRIYKEVHRKDQNYFFRVRTQLDNNGNIIGANYGKIYNHIGFSIPNPEKSEKGELYFSYYLNPNNNDINIEFSPEKNLFPKPEGVRGKYRFNP